MGAENKQRPPWPLTPHAEWLPHFTPNTDPKLWRNKHPGPIRKPTHTENIYGHAGSTRFESQPGPHCVRWIFSKLRSTGDCKFPLRVSVTFFPPLGACSSSTYLSFHSSPRFGARGRKPAETHPNPSSDEAPPPARRTCDPAEYDDKTIRSRSRTTPTVRFKHNTEII